MAGRFTAKLVGVSATPSDFCDKMAYFTTLFTAMIVIGVMVGFEYLVWVTSGWKSLQKFFRFRGKFCGKKFRGVSGTMEKGLHQGSINIGVNNVGVFLWQSDLFQGVFHRNLLIPWESLDFQQLRIERVEFLVRASGTRIVLDSEKVNREIMSYFNDVSAKSGV